MLLIARPYKSDEQGLRAELLSHWDGIEQLDPEMLDASTWAEKIAAALTEDRKPRATGMDFNGIENAAGALMKFLG